MYNSLFTSYASTSLTDIYEIADSLRREYYEIFSGGCALNDTSEANCTTACANQTWLYGSVQRLNNCLVAPYVAANLSVQDPQTTAHAQRLGISELSILVSNYSAAIAKCFSQTCSSSTSCSANGNACENLQGPNNTLRSAQLRGCFQHLCLDSSFTANADIGGIGVIPNY